MRIKQNDLPITPDYQYSRLICGVLGTVQIFHEPELCVNIIQLKYNKRIAHCYPIDSATYARYKREAIDWYYPDKKRYKKLANKYHNIANNTKDANLKVFYASIAECYDVRSK